MADMNGFEETEIPDPAEVPRRIAELGLTIELLAEAVRRGQLSADFITLSHPRSSSGLMVWIETNGALREQCAYLGWEFNDDDNIPRAISPDGAVVITAVSGNERTGLRGGENAQTRRKRGEAGRRMIRRNAQIEMLEMLPAEQRELVEREVGDTGATWFLLHYRAGDVVRSELSCARGVSEDGCLLDWSERLALPEIDLTELPPTSMPDSGGPGPDVVVPVTSRVA